MSRIASIGTLLVLLTLPGTAQTIVTESDFLSGLHTEHPAAVEAAEDRALARAALVAASRFDNPTIEGVREDPSGSAAQTDVMLSWQLPDASRAHRIEAAEQQLLSTGARLAQSLLSLRLEMREIYAQWAIATARAERLAFQLEQIDELVRREELRAARGEASGLEAHRLALAASTLRAGLALSLAQQEESRAKARVWNRTMPEDARPLLPDLPALPPTTDQHPLVAAARAELNAAVAERSATQRFVRSPEVMAGWQRQSAGDDSLDGPLLGVSWSLPMFDRNQADRLIAEARVRAAEARLERIALEIEARRAAAAIRYRTLAESVAVVGSAASANDRMLHAAEAAFLQGEANLTDFLDMLRSVTEAELAILELREAALAALRDLERLTGPTALRTFDAEKETTR